MEFFSLLNLYLNQLNAIAKINKFALKYLAP